ncbi:hypothetical protein FB451DRAFT_1555771 [Mycena latifolia]|nr:hypothetical protein FB451DRAFT_1555771 [Mycena latifolia]
MSSSPIGETCNVPALLPPPSKPTAPTPATSTVKAAAPTSPVEPPTSTAPSVETAPTASPVITAPAPAAAPTIRTCASSLATAARRTTTTSSVTSAAFWPVAFHLQTIFSTFTPVRVAMESVDAPFPLDPFSGWPATLNRVGLTPQITISALVLLVISLTLTLSFIKWPRAALFLFAGLCILGERDNYESSTLIIASIVLVPPLYIVGKWGKSCLIWVVDQFILDQLDVGETLEDEQKRLKEDLNRVTAVYEGKVEIENERARSKWNVFVDIVTLRGLFMSWSGFWEVYILQRRVERLKQKLDLIAQLAKRDL